MTDVKISEHIKEKRYKHKLVPGFTKKYNVNKLVYFEETNDVTIALAREKEIKKWNRKKGINSY